MPPMGKVGKAKGKSSRQGVRRGSRAAGAKPAGRQGRPRAETAQDSEQRFRSLVEAVSDWVWQVDRNGVYTYCSPKVKDILGYEPQEVIGRSPMDLMPADEAERVGALFGSMAAARQPIEHLENVNLHKDGHRVVLETSGVPMLDADGNLLGYRGIDQDITERKRVEGALRASEERFRQVVQNMPVMMDAFDAQKRIVAWNTECERVTGYSAAEIIANPKAMELLYPDAAYRKRMMAQWAARGDDYRDWEWTMTCKDGSTRHVVWSNLSRLFPVPGWTTWGIGVDITERKLAEEALRENERRFRAIFDQTFQFIGLMTPEGILIEANRTALAFAEIKECDVLGKPFWETPWWTHSPALQEKLRAGVKAASEGELVRFEATHPASDGSIHYVDFSLKPVCDESGKVVLLIPEGRDITERKLAEQELLSVQRQIEFIIGATKTGLDIIDGDLNLRYIDPEWQKVYGDFRGRKCYEYFMDRSEPCPGCGVLRALQTKQICVTEESLRKEGGRPIQVTTIPFQNERGEWLVAEVNVDITERKRAEAALRESEERFRSLVESAPEAIFVHSQRRFVYVNPAVLRLLGASRSEELLGMDCMRRVAPEYHDGVRERIRFQRETGQPVPLMDQEYVRLDGTRVSVETTAVPIRYQGEQAHLVFVRDITERKLAEEALQKAHDELEQRVAERTAELVKANEALKTEMAERQQAEQQRERLESQLREAQKMEAVGRLAAGVAHDFNNLLTVVLGNAEVLQRKLKQGRSEFDPGVVSGVVEEIRQAAERGAGLTQQLLAFGRKQVQHPQVLDPNKVIAGTIRMLRRLIGEHIELEVRAAPDVGHIRADAGQIEQTVMNLVLNARDAMPQGGRLTIETANVMLDEQLGARAGPHVMIAVSDTGAGMSEETRSHLFEPFFTTKPMGKGTGMGLATTYGIIKQANGHIAVDSRPGEGTTFRVYLPLWETVTDPDTGGVNAR